MNLQEIKNTIYGRNNLDCLVSLENVNGKIWFSDFTKNICRKVYTQEQLNDIVQNNSF